MVAKSESVVRFASCKVKELRREATLPLKFQRMLKKYPFKRMFKDQQVAIKMHVGGDVGYTTIHPLFVKFVVDTVKDAGGRPFITDGTGAIQTARNRGYTEEVLGAPLVEAAGIANNYAVTKAIGFKTLENIDICGNIADAGAMIVLSHLKGHGDCGFGGAIKNIAMGCVARNSRGQLHRLEGHGFHWDPKICKHCGLCLEHCPAHMALRFEGKQLVWEPHQCRFCRHCQIACPVKAIEISAEATRNFQKGLALATKAVLDTFKPSRLFYINVLLNITPLCDCWGLSTPSLVPDIGIAASSDIVALEQASLDMVRTENLIPNSLPEMFSLGKGKHLFEKIHGKDPYLQVKCAEEIGLGARNYRIEEME